MCVYIHMCMCIYMYVYACDVLASPMALAGVCTIMFRFVCLYIYNQYMCVYQYLCVHIYMDVCIYICIRMRCFGTSHGIHSCIYVYVYICMFTFMINIYI